MREYLDIAEFKPSYTDNHQTPIEPSSEPRTELEANSTRTLFEFPCTRVEAGKALEVSDVTVGKWIAKIHEAGVTVTDPENRITAEGFILLEGYKEAKNKTRYVADLIATLPIPEPEATALATVEPIRYESTIDLSYSTDEYYQAQAEEYGELDNLTSSTESPEVQIAQAIKERYWDCTEEIAPAIASEFWRRLDGQVAQEIIKQRDRGFLASVGDRLAQLPQESVAINALTAQ